jgi:SapC
MINELLHRNPVAIDRQQHLQTRLQLPLTDWSVASRLNALFIAAAEFTEACREFPIVFVRTGQDEDGKPQIAPIAVFGLLQNDNLYAEGSAWRAGYIPAVLRAYPFGIGKIENQRFAICMDAAWSGISQTEGQALFTPEGQPSEMLTAVQRTRLVCQKLQELDVLRDMRFDATLPDGRKHTVDGFLTVDDARMQALPDAVVADMHRQGLLGLVHAHWVSMANMRRLLDWHIVRHGGAKAPAA